MLGTGNTLSLALRQAPVAQVSRTQVEVFDSLYDAFLALGTIVGILVIAYLVYNAYKYRTTDDDATDRYDIEEADPGDDDYDVARPRRGEIPTGQGKGGGKKLFMSFGISAVLVLGLIIYSYSLLLYVEDTGNEDEDALYVDVEGYQFGWEYTYNNGETELDSTEDEYEDVVANITEEVEDIRYEDGSFVHNEEGYSADEVLIVPKGYQTTLNVTATDVFHNYGIPEFRAKTDAMPDQYTTTWFQPEKTGTYEAICYELCGQQHSNMKGPVVVAEPDDFMDEFTELDEFEESDFEFIEGDV